MTNELFEKLAKRWPDLMEKSQQHYLGVGEGWFNLIDTICSGMMREVSQARYKLNYAMENQGTKYAMTIPDAEAALAAAIDALPVIVQIKEKFGGLRFYCDGASDEIGHYIAFAEQMSHKTCEVCGAPGEPRNDGWVKTLCDTHHRENKEAQDAVASGRRPPKLFED